MSEPAVIDASSPEAAKVGTETPQIGVPINIHIKDDASKVDFQSIVPDEYKDRPWVKEILKNGEPTKEMFKQYEEAQKLIGSRTQGIIPPPENATPEQMKAFFKQLGVPDEIERYELPPTAWDESDKVIGEAITKSRNEAALKQIKIEAQRQGVTPKQLQALTHTFEKTQAQLLKQSEALTQENMAKQNTEFIDSLKGKFGDKWDDTVKNGRKLIDAYVPEELRKAFPSFDNKQGLALAVALHSIHNSLVKGETFTGTGNDTGVGMQPAKTAASVRQKAMELMANPAYKDVTHPKNKALVAEVRALYRDNTDLLLKK